MSEPFQSEIKIFAGDFAPRGYAFCYGQLMSATQNQALFSLLGTMYGGDGVTTFGIPDLRGRAPMSKGIGAGLTPRLQGQMFGMETVTLRTENLPSHTHHLHASTADPVTNIPADAVTGNAPYYSVFTGSKYAQIQDKAVGTAGAGQVAPHSNIMPVIALNYIIALNGTYPPRN